ncbi:MAG: transcription termination/antitermination protein NusG, partial [Acidimicrobiaceae bacterium]|nr:transcription termination/antitermination protein NusG [Acidimicrobiaceae bacterium]
MSEIDQNPTNVMTDAPVTEAPEATDPPAEAVLSEDEVLGIAAEEDVVEAAPVIESAYDRPGQWYVVHTYAGYENKVKNNLMSRIASMNMEERIFEVVIPMEDVAEFKNGKRVVVQKKV